MGADRLTYIATPDQIDRTTYNHPEIFTASDDILLPPNNANFFQAHGFIQISNDAIKDFADEWGSAVTKYSNFGAGVQWPVFREDILLYRADKVFVDDPHANPPGRVDIWFDTGSGFVFVPKPISTVYVASALQLAMQALLAKRPSWTTTALCLGVPDNPVTLDVFDIIGESAFSNQSDDESDGSDQSGQPHPHQSASSWETGRSEWFDVDERERVEYFAPLFGTDEGDLMTVVFKKKVSYQWSIRRLYQIGFNRGKQQMIFFMRPSKRSRH